MASLSPRMEDPSRDIDAWVLAGGNATVFEALERVENLTHEMRESEALAKRLVARLQFLRSVLKKPSTMDLNERFKLVARFETAIGNVLRFLKTFSKKKALQRIAASRLVREGVRRLHSTVDAVFQYAELSDAPEMNEWKEHEAADVGEQLKRLGEIVETRGSVVRDLSKAEVEEALLEIRLEIERHSNPEDFVALLKRAFTDPVVSEGVKMWEPEDWFVRRDDIELADTPFDMGSFGDVFKARRGVKPAEVCVKLLIADGPDAQADFLKEAQIWHKLSHTNVLAMLGGCHVGSPLFFVSGLAKAGNFVDYFYKTENKGRLWELFRQAAEGLSYLHSQKVVHANVKCNNLLVGDDGLAKVCDFGFSYIKTRSIGKSLKAQPSSARWKAPECLLEQGSAGEPTFVSDVFSLGMSIIEAKTGNVPWGMKSDDEIIDAMFDSDCYPRPDGVFTDREWELVEGMTAFNPKERWSLDRALEVMRELEILQEEDTVAAIWQELVGPHVTSLEVDFAVLPPQHGLEKPRVAPRPDALTPRDEKLLDRVTKINPNLEWTHAQVNEFISDLIEEEQTAATRRVGEQPNAVDTKAPKLPNPTPLQEELKLLVDHIQRTPSLDDNDRDRFLRQVQQVSEWYQLEAEMAEQWESNFPEISLCSSCESDNPLDNSYCCECGEAIEGGSWQSRREKLDFRFAVSDVSRVEAAIAEMEELCDHERAEAVMLRRYLRQCSGCLEGRRRGKRFCGDCGNPLDITFSAPTLNVSLEVRLKLQAEIQRLKSILQRSREQEATIRKANEVPPLELPCSQCGEMNSELEFFCRECGNDIEIIRANPL